MLTHVDSELVEFPTTNSNDESRMWVRTRGQLRAEAGIVADTLLGSVDHVACFAPRTQLYGHVFGGILPALLGASVEDLSPYPTVAPNPVPGRRVLYVCLPASWRILHAMACRGVDLSGSYALHSNGPTAPTVSAVAASLGAAGLSAFELYGSIETGVIAHRPATGPAHHLWQLFSDVSLLDTPHSGDTRTLHVGSPRVARLHGDSAVGGPRTHQFNELIHMMGHDRFMVHGSPADLCLVEGLHHNRARHGRVGVEANRVRRGVPH